MKGARSYAQLVVLERAQTLVDAEVFRRLLEEGSAATQPVNL